MLPEDQIEATCEETMEAVLSILDDVDKKYSNSAGKVTATTVALSLLLTAFHSLWVHPFSLSTSLGPILWNKMQDVGACLL